MPIDQQDVFCTAQAVTASAISTNVIDMVTQYARHGVGARPLYVCGYVTTQFADTGSNSTADVILQSSQYVGINSSITNTTIGTIGTNAAVGRLFITPIPQGAIVDQYCALYFNVASATGDFSAGNITCWITADPDEWFAKPVSYTGVSNS